jgi:tetratricopeptide (TPR) repeat protein
MRRLFRTLSFGSGWLLVVLLAAGCGPSRRLAQGSETNEPQYRLGLQLLKQGRNQEALGAFLKVIDARGDEAPESHLEAGLIYQEDFKDPVAAIYHYRKYLEVLPNSRQADLVRQRIEASMREFARTIPGQPLESQTARFDLMDKIAQLQQENQQLKDQIAALRSGVALGGRDVPAGAPAADAGPAPVIRRQPAPGPSAIRVPGASAPPAGTAGAASPPAGTMRTHVVAPGDTLYKIAQRYYGNGARWPEILQANRELLKGQNAVRPGMELRIP